MRDYHNYDVWHRSLALTLAVRRAARGIKGAMNASLRSQAVRAAESITFNIVEGCGSAHDKEFARFLNISISSSNELECQLELAYKDDLISQHQWQVLTAETKGTRKMLCGLRRKVLLDLQREEPRKRKAPAAGPPLAERR
jgi:four helix bundle protein